MTEDFAQKRSIPSLDGIRAIAVLLVIVAHLGLMNRAGDLLTRHHATALLPLVQIDAGDLGVSAFFIISGFLITTLLLRHTDYNDRVLLGSFYARRFFRIFPPYYFYLLVIGILWSVRAVPMLRGAFISAALYCSNYFPYRLSQPAGAGWLVGHTWSLSLEEQFYLLWPACLRWLGRQRAGWLGFALIIVSPVSRLLTLYFLPGTALYGQVDRMFHSRIDTIMVGCVLALIGNWPTMQRALAGAVTLRWSAWLAGILLFVVLHISQQSFRTTQVLGIGCEAILLAYLIAFAIANAGTWVGRLLNLAALRHVGMISYSLYLWQQLWVGPIQIGGPHHLWTRLLLTLVCAEISYFAIERPSFRLRDVYLRHRTNKVVLGS
jgi:peptidoglycan/LPS O-acetylase OafA/YrhL